jgi:short-subunit dehydrogenase
VTTALVTGATAGIGLEFSRQLAASGTDLVLIARDTTRLAEVAEQLRARHAVEVETLSADLSDRAALETVAERLRDTGRPVDILVNNAGFGLTERFLTGDVADEERLLDVLVRAVLVLTRAAVPPMVERGTGTVITVSSVAGFFPGGTYSAVKAWATTFSISLAGELAGTGVKAMALCPGYVRTEFHRRAGLSTRGIPGWLWLAPERLVAEALADARRGRAVSIPSRKYKVLTTFLRHTPLRLLSLVWRPRFRKNVPSTTKRQ